MRSNPARRNTLVDAAIEVLARDGARGLTYRAVDEAAAVPIGTATNYFTNRDDLLGQASLRVHDRLGPDPAHLDKPPSKESLTELIQFLRRRLAEDRTGYLALLELRLEATRRPELQKSLTRRVRANLLDNLDLHEATGLPGDRTTALMLYLAIGGLMVEHLTLPGVLCPDGEGIDELIATIVERVLGRPGG
ncbi:TetR/AcrR family transcriptional regulator [Kribbella deserti]|uniref:TetR/AcrR family transcriptional regulator n=1 Tax=Kribbella deserti TaxID=1926257 RepID=A0ABV6QMP5_9ACTN